MNKIYDLHDYVAKPFDTVIEALEANNKSDKDLINYLSINKSTYNEYIDAKIEISEEFSEKLGNFFGISKNFFFKLQGSYNNHKKIFHELGHVLLHQNQDIIDCDEEAIMSRRKTSK